MCSARLRAGGRLPLPGPDGARSVQAMVEEDAGAGRRERPRPLDTLSRDAHPPRALLGASESRRFGPDRPRVQSLAASPRRRSPCDPEVQESRPSQCPVRGSLTPLGMLRRGLGRAITPPGARTPTASRPETAWGCLRPNQPSRGGKRPTPMAGSCRRSMRVGPRRCWGSYDERHAR